MTTIPTNLGSRPRLGWLAASLLLLIACPVLGQSAEGDPPREFDQFWMVFLERGENPPELDAEASAQLQRRHLAHLSKMRREGYSLVAGPFEAPPEEAMRGIVIYRGDLGKEEVVALAEADPAVKAGRLSVRILKWWTGKGSVIFPEPTEGT